VAICILSRNSTHGQLHAELLLVQVRSLVQEYAWSFLKRLVAMASKVSFFVLIVIHPSLGQLESPFEALELSCALSIPTVLDARQVLVPIVAKWMYIMGALRLGICVTKVTTFSKFFNPLTIIAQFGRSHMHEVSIITAERMTIMGRRHWLAATHQLAFLGSRVAVDCVAPILCYTSGLACGHRLA
jgi:hypothetical protein